MNTNLRRNTKVLSGGIDEDMVLLDLDENNYLVISSVARRIWELIEDPIVFEDLCNTLMDEYEVDTDTCKNETIEFLTVLDDKGMLICNE